eukprot:GDKH01006878.1.p2 GENE.GDKH01006878.1~~GDKH01006878.1.p2  ORF type:complete len:52 (-),score=3.61 GDKH01006878.1:117-272(-)
MVVVCGKLVVGVMEVVDKGELVGVMREREIVVLGRCVSVALVVIDWGIELV